LPAKPAPTTFFWCTTSPHPRSRSTGYDAGQRGWRLHAVLAVDGEDYQQYKRRPALCGTAARHGWGLDMFIDEECTRCQNAMTKREKSGEVFVDLAVIAQERRRSQLVADEIAEDARRASQMEVAQDDE
jgi:hypothetical protein